MRFSPFFVSLKMLPLRLDRQESNAQAIAKALNVLSAVKVFTFAESLGEVESLITYPTTQTHADVPKGLREFYGLTADLLRLSVGIENVGVFLYCREL